MHIRDPVDECISVLTVHKQYLSLNNSYNALISMCVWVCIFSTRQNIRITLWTLGHKE